MNKMLTCPLILVDGSSYLYRAYHTLPLLINSAGEPTGAIYGVLNMLRSLILCHQPTHIAIIFDAKGKTFRDKLFSSYKSHRRPMPDNLRDQIEPLHKIIKALGLPLMTISGVEADDVIGTLARSAEKSGHHVLISTIDKDMAQLVTPNITLINTINNRRLGPKEVYDKYGVPPELIIDLLALMGDSSDNIPGVPNIGEKTAHAILKGIGNLKQIYRNLDKVATLSFRGAKNIAEKLKLHKDKAELSYLLATIKTDVKLNTTYDDLRIKPIETTTLYDLFSQYEFKRWLENAKNGSWLRDKKKIIQAHQSEKNNNKNMLDIAQKATDFLTTQNYKIIIDDVTLCALIASLKTAKIFAFNTHTDSLDEITGNLVGLSFAITPGLATYIPVSLDSLYVPDIVERVNYYNALEKLKPLLEDIYLLKIGQNLKYDQSLLARYGIKLQGIAFDTMIESYNLDSSHGSYDLAHLSARYLNRTAIFLKNIKRNKEYQEISHKITFKQDPICNLEAVDLILQLHLKLWPEIKKIAILKKVFTEIDMPCVPVLSRMERTGVLINRNILSKESKNLGDRLYELEKRAHKDAGELFNLYSTKQLQCILFKKQKLPVIRKNLGGAPSADKEVLTKLAAKGFQLPSIILEHRSLAKLKGSYSDKLPQMINPNTGRIHTSYHQAVTTTGRISSSNPNLQNIPIRSAEGRRIRHAFIAPQNYKILAADYSQIELRVMAHLSGDKMLIAEFNAGKDIHCATAADMFGIKLEEVSTVQRRDAKAINFGLMYGMSAFGLARQLNITHVAAQSHIDIYFARYPQVLEYTKRMHQYAFHKGYVETIEGRRMYLPDIYSRNLVRRKAAERSAINAPIQGTAADIIKRAMISIDTWLMQQKTILVRMIMQVHDELVFEVHESAIEQSTKKVREIMEADLRLTVPIVVEIGTGRNWEQAH
ncbi:DNA polymerase I [Candidatus Profftia tarda]|uniref:DNA polymerase I n=1 Tax=Candidatus Profftia tarda TaxID=1177216 RepID=A0A8E4MES5_9ENTR|nr:DNA polymerase I [Candidatus Profftia tarda]CAD6512906.1 DNA polymerase I [Candidatus Profftia tarda]